MKFGIIIILVFLDFLSKKIIFNFIELNNFVSILPFMYITHIHNYGISFGLFSGLYYWYPKAFGRKLDERIGVIHFLISFIAYNAAFWPMHIVGTMGMPRRTHTYTMESGYATLNY